MEIIYLCRIYSLTLTLTKLWKLYILVRIRNEMAPHLQKYVDAHAPLPISCILVHVHYGLDYFIAHVSSNEIDQFSRVHGGVP